MFYFWIHHTLLSHFLGGKEINYFVEFKFLSIDNLHIPDLILQLYVIGVFQLSYIPYRGQNGSRSMQERLIGQRIWIVKAETKYGWNICNFSWNLYKMDTFVCIKGK